ncbi:MAG: hypothetical protein H6937_06080 [Burkholderiales bacterium]|nr:hypothetical protein [Burkholderiales bacterium]
MTKATARYCLLIFLCLLLSGCSGLMYYPDTKNQFFDPKAAGYAPEDIFSPIVRKEDYTAGGFQPKKRLPKRQSFSFMVTPKT